MKNMFEKLGAESLQKNIDQLTGRSEIHNAIKATSAVGSFQEHIDKLMRGNSIQNAWKAMSAASLYQESISNTLNRSSIQSAIKATSAVGSYQEHIDKLMGGNSIQNAWKAMSAVSSHQESISNILNRNSIQSAIKATSAVNSYQEHIDKLMGGNSIQNAWKAMSTMSSRPEAINGLINKHSFQNAVDNFAAPTNLWATFDLISHASTQLHVNAIDDIELQNEQIEHQLNEIAAAKDSASLIKKFSQLHPSVQAVFLFILLHLFLPITQNITANIITPHVEKIINDPETTEREKIKRLKIFSLNELDLSDLRFVTTERLLLREHPSTNSKIKDELRLGQIVTMVNKQRNWMEVSYTYEDGEIIYGWVFSRYTEKFKE